VFQSEFEWSTPGTGPDSGSTDLSPGGRQSGAWRAPARRLRGPARRLRVDSDDVEPIDCSVEPTDGGRRVRRRPDRCNALSRDHEESSLAHERSYVKPTPTPVMR
jgi:hypothetical protein